MALRVVALPVAILILVGLLGFGFITPAGAQSGDGDSNGAETTTPLPPISLTVTAQSAVVQANRDFLVDIAINPSDLGERRPEIQNFNLAVTVFDRVIDESEVDLPPSVPINRLEPVRLGDLKPMAPGQYRLKLPIRSGTGAASSSRVMLAESGVYPVTIELRTDDGIVAATRTNLIPETDTNGVDVEVDIGAGASSDSDPDNDQNGDVIEELAFSSPLRVATVLTVVPAEGVTVQDAARLLTNHPDAPITVLMTEGVASQLEAEPELASTFLPAVGGRSVVTRPMVDLDPSALAEIGRGAIYRRALEDTWADLRDLGLEPRTDVTVVSRPLTAAGVEALGEMGITTIIDTSRGEDTSGYVRSGSHRIELLRFDSDLSELFSEGTSGVLQANRVLAHLTLRAAIDRTPVVLGGTEMGQRPTGGLDVLQQWLTETASPESVAIDQATNGTLQRRLAEQPTQNLAADASLLADIEAILSAYEGMAQGAGDDPSGTTTNEYRRRLWSALALNRNADDRRRALLVFSEELGQELEFITLPVAQTVTMAARDGAVPLIVESRAAGPRRVMLRFRSDKFKVVQDSQLVTVEPGTSSIDVEVQARSLGSSQIEVSVWTPDGAIRLASNQFQVRSTAVPGLGLLISGGALAFLILWWFLDHRSRQDTALGDEGLEPESESAPSPADAVGSFERGGSAQTGQRRFDIAGDVVERGRTDGPTRFANEGNRRRLVGHE